MLASMRSFSVSTRLLTRTARSSQQAAAGAGSAGAGADAAGAAARTGAAAAGTGEALPRMTCSRLAWAQITTPEATSRSSFCCIML